MFVRCANRNRVVHFLHHRAIRKHGAFRRKDKETVTSPPEDCLNQMSIARQPIVDGRRQVVAYELFNRSQSVSTHSVASDISLALNAVAQSGAPFAISNCDLFLNSLHQGLGGAHWDFLNPATTVVEVPPVAGHDPVQIGAVVPALAALQSRGFRLSFHYSVVAPLYKSWQPLSNFVKLDVATVPAPQLAPLLGAIHARTPATVIAAKVERSEQFDQLKAHGVDRFQGFWFSVPEVVTPRVLSPGEVCAVQLFNLLRNAADVDAVEEVLKKDAGLSVSLLRIINSAGVGLSQTVTSLRQAVMLMGYDRLSRWAAMLMATASTGSASLLSTSSVVRARLMELLALEQPGALDGGTAFLVGLLSQLDRMLGTSMLQALNQLALDEEVKSALLNGGGAYGDLLALAVACESEDDAGFAAAFARLGYTTRQVNMAHMEALAWADGVAP